MFLLLPFVAKADITASGRQTKYRSRSTEELAAAAKLSKRAVEAIPDTTTPSLYDRSSAQTPNSGMLNWFGPKADGVRYDSRMIHAAQIAEARARQHSIRSCWRYVKEALVEIRTKDGFVSDFESPTPSKRPLLGIFVKPT